MSGFAQDAQRLDPEGAPARAEGNALNSWEPSYLLCSKQGEPTLTDPEQIKAFWRKWREERGEK